MTIGREGRGDCGDGRVKAQRYYALKGVIVSGWWGV